MLCGPDRSTNLYRYGHPHISIISYDQSRYIGNYLRFFCILGIINQLQRYLEPMFTSSLIGAIGDILAPRPDQDRFYSLIYSLQLENALEILRQKDVFWIDDVNEKGLAPIHVAAAAGAMAIVVELLSMGASIDTISSTGKTAIHYAAMNNQKGIVHILLRSGCDPSVPDSDGLVAAEITSNMEIKAMLMRPSFFQSPRSNISNGYTTQDRSIQIDSLKAKSFSPSILVDGTSEETNQSHQSVQDIFRELVHEREAMYGRNAQHTSSVLPTYKVTPAPPEPALYHNILSLTNDYDDEKGLLTTTNELRILVASVAQETAEARILDLRSKEAAARRLVLLACLNQVDASTTYLQTLLELKPSLADFRVTQELASGPEFTALLNATYGFRDSVDGFTPLHIAAGCHNVNAVSALLQYGKISSWARDLRGRTALHTAVSCAAATRDGSRDDTRQTALVSETCSFLRQRMREESGIDPIGVGAPLDLTGVTPLGLATARILGGSSGLLQVLLAEGDVSVLPHVPIHKRSGKSPWKVPGFRDGSENIVYSHSQAKGFGDVTEAENETNKNIGVGRDGYQNQNEQISEGIAGAKTEFTFASCPLPRRPTWGLFGVSSATVSGGPLCASLVAEQFPRVLAAEAERCARFLRTTTSPTKNPAQHSQVVSAGDDMLPRAFADALLRVACAKVDRALACNPVMKAVSIKLPPLSPRSDQAGRDQTWEAPLLSVLSDTGAVDDIRRKGDRSLSQALVSTVTAALDSNLGTAATYDRIIALDSSDASLVTCLVTSHQVAVCIAGANAIVLALLHEDITVQRPSPTVSVSDPFNHPYKPSPATSDSSARTTSSELPWPSSVPAAAAMHTEVLTPCACVTPDLSLCSCSGAGAFARFGNFLRKVDGRAGAPSPPGASSSEALADSVVPHVWVYDRSSLDAFIILASQSVWNVFGAQEAVGFIASRLGYTANTGPVGGCAPAAVAMTCDELLKECVRRGARGSLSAALVILGAPLHINNNSSSGITAVDVGVCACTTEMESEEARRQHSSKMASSNGSSSSKLTTTDSLALQRPDECEGTWKVSLHTSSAVPAGHLNAEESLQACLDSVKSMQRLRAAAGTACESAPAADVSHIPLTSPRAHRNSNKGVVGARTMQALLEATELGDYSQAAMKPGGIDDNNIVRNNNDDAPQAAAPNLTYQTVVYDSSDIISEATATPPHRYVSTNQDSTGQSSNKLTATLLAYTEENTETPRPSTDINRHLLFSE